jgi:uncharacterized protein YuzE
MEGDRLAEDEGDHKCHPALARGIAVQVIYDPEADIAGVFFVEGPDAHAVSVDPYRSVEYSSAGEVVGVEFEDASSGVWLLGLPIDILAVGRALIEAGVPVVDGLLTFSGTVSIAMTASASSAALT